MGDDVDACYNACAAEADCLAYALHTLAFGTAWVGLCYGRGHNAPNTLVPQDHMMSGVRFPC